MVGQGKRIETFNQSLGAADWDDEKTSGGDWANNRNSNEGNHPMDGDGRSEY